MVSNFSARRLQRRLIEQRASWPSALRVRRTGGCPSALSRVLNGGCAMCAVGGARNLKAPVSFLLLCALCTSQARTYTHRTGFWSPIIGVQGARRARSQRSCSATEKDIMTRVRCQSFIRVERPSQSGRSFGDSPPKKRLE